MSEPNENRTNDNTNETDCDRFITEAADEIRELLAAANRDDADAKYRVGARVAAVRAQAREKKYGGKIVERLAKAVGVTASALYQYADVATTWDQESFAAILGQKNKNGVGLAFSTFVELAHKDHTKHREDRVQQALEEGLSIRELRAKRLGTKATMRNQFARLAKAPASSHLIKRLDADVNKLEKQRREIEARLEQLRAIANTKREELAKTKQPADPSNATAQASEASAPRSGKLRRNGATRGGRGLKLSSEVSARVRGEAASAASV